MPKQLQTTFYVPIRDTGAHFFGEDVQGPRRIVIHATFDLLGASLALFENRLRRHERGLTMTVDKSMDANLLEAHTETVIGDAQAVADQEHIETVFVTAPKRRTGRSI